MNRDNLCESKDSKISCGTCLSYNETKGKCDSVDAMNVKVFPHNVCKYHLSVKRLAMLLTQ